jgi:hypothetical protein
MECNGNQVKEQINGMGTLGTKSDNGNENNGNGNNDEKKVKFIKEKGSINKRYKQKEMTRKSESKHESGGVGNEKNNGNNKDEKDNKQEMENNGKENEMENEMDKESWRLKATKNGKLLDEHGNELERKLGLDDGQKREAMVESVKAEINLTTNKEQFDDVISKAEKGEWYPVNIGRSFISEDTVYNLFAAVAARRKGLGTVLPIGKNERCYMYDGTGRRYYMREVGNQLRFTARLYGADGTYKTIEMVHDSGASANILKKGDAELWQEHGTGEVLMGGWTGKRDKLIGGNDLCIMLKGSTGDEWQPEEHGMMANEQDNMAMIMEEIAKEDDESNDIEECGCLGEEMMKGEALSANLISNKNNNNVFNNNKTGNIGTNKGSILDDKCEEAVLDRQTQLEDVLSKSDDDTHLMLEEMMEGLTSEQRKQVLGKLKSAQSLGKLMDKQEQDSKPAITKLGKEIGIQSRVQVMEEYCRKFPHLSMKKLNRMVSEGDIGNGIEMKEEARVRDAAFYMAKGTKVKTHKKRNKKKGDDAGQGYRPPFFMVELDLIDLTNETAGNKWGYNWLLVITCREYGLVKIFPLKGKDDVRLRWRQFKQWLVIITPYTMATLGVAPAVAIVGCDRGSEFITTHGRTRGELDEELFNDNIYRYTPSAGDSNKMGKVERLNSIIMNNVNYMLRLAGAKNEWAYYAVGMFEEHYNSTPTDANKVGKGEAPYKTIGVPINMGKFVRFMCPAYVRRPKNLDADTGKSTNRKKLVEKMELGMIIGYGGAFSQGADHDGYKVLIPENNENGGEVVYSSNDVFPVEDMEVTRSFLTGRSHDPLDEGKLIKRQFDLAGEESLLPQEQRAIGNGQVSGKTTGRRGMTAGTGTTGQMRHEMDGNKSGTLRTGNDVITKNEAKRRVMIGRARNLELIWKTPEEANKRGKCRIRYNIYYKTKTVKEFELLCARRSVARKDDMVNDLTKGLLKIEIPGGIGEENDVEDYDVPLCGQVGGDVETVRPLTFGMVRYGEREILEMKVEKMEVLNLNYDEEVDDETILSIVKVLKERTEMKEVPTWMALAVYHNAEVWVDGRKQPYTIQEAKGLKEWEEWKAAIMKEIAGLIAVGVWKEVWRSDLKAGTKVLPGRMVLEIKTVDGKFEKCKARYVSRGDLSTRGEHYYESSSHQVRSKSLKMFYATAVTDYAKTGKQSKVPRNLDISQAYLARKRTEHEPEVYMELPTDTFGLGSDKGSGKVAKMLRHLYGEVDGGRAFERELLEFLQDIGAVATVSDRMVFLWKWNGQELTALAHVDDIIYNGDGDEILDEFYKRAEKHFGKLTGGTTAEYILGIKIIWDYENKTVTLSQQAHVEKFLKAFGYDPATTKSKETPMPLDVNIVKNEGDKVPTHIWDTYMWVGFANWLVSMTRVDMAGVTNMIGRHSNNPGVEHVDIMRHAMRYLAGTMDLGLTFHGGEDVLSKPYDHRNKLVGYVDSMHGPGADTMCVIIMLNGAAVIWKVLKQRVVTTSTAHSEMIALAAGARELQWATDFMAELGHEQGTVRMMGDNQSANMQATGDYKSTKSDHYRRVQFYVEDTVGQGVMWIDKVPTTENIADMGTKQVTPIKQFKRLRDIAQGRTPSLYLSVKVQEILNGDYDRLNNDHETI